MNIFPPMQPYTGIAKQQTLAEEFGMLAKMIYDRLDNDPAYPGFIFVCSMADEHSAIPFIVKQYIRTLLKAPDIDYVHATVGEYVHNYIKHVPWVTMTTYEKNLYRAAWCAHIAKELAK